MSPVEIRLKNICYTKTYNDRRLEQVSLSTESDPKFQTLTKYILEVLQ